MPLVIPFRFLVDDIADADQMNSVNDAIAAKFNAGIVDADISPGAGIDGNKLSSDGAKQVPESRLGTNSVSNRVLQSSATGDSLRAVGTDSCKDSFLIARHITDGIIPAGKLKKVDVTQTFTSLGVNGEIVLVPLIPALSAMMPISAIAEGVTIVGGTLYGIQLSLYDVAGVTKCLFYARATAGAVSGTIRFRYLQPT
jgi:hypothetical protein